LRSPPICSPPPESWCKALLFFIPRRLNTFASLGALLLALIGRFFSPPHISFPPSVLLFWSLLHSPIYTYSPSLVASLHLYNILFSALNYPRIIDVSVSRFFARASGSPGAWASCLTPLGGPPDTLPQHGWLRDPVFPQYCGQTPSFALGSSDLVP